MRVYILLIGLYVAANTAIAQNVVVYRWVDKNNVVHFSQHQPQHDNYTEIQVSTNATRSDSAQDKAEEEPTEEEQPLALIPSTEKCEEAKANVRVLRTYDKIQYTNESGETLLLSESEKQQQLAINEKQVEVYCAGQ